ncbi:HAMP domain-containing sensor histidine kinase [Clostridioides difficile]
MLNTIRGKVTLWSIVIVGVLNIFLSMYIYFIINNKLDSTIQDNMEVIKVMAKNFSMLQIDTGESDLEVELGAKKVVDALYNMFGDYVGITLDKDEILKGRGNLLSNKKAKSILEESQNKKSLLMLTKEKESYIATFNYPLYIEENYYGNIIVQKDYFNEYSENMKILVTIFIGQFAILIMLIIAIWLIVKKFTNPLNKLSDAIETFGRGEEQEDIKIESKDEVSILATNFNFMKNEIKEQMSIIIKEQSKSKEFFNNATHELKTPITAISGYTQLLLSEDILEMDEEFRNRALERMFKESNKLNSLVKNILEISRGEAKKILIREEFDLADIIYKKINDMSVRLMKSNVKIRSNIRSTKVKYNKEEINTIIINLLDNAIKYTAGETIILELYDDEKNTIFEIKNEIYYIPEKIKYCLLDPFVKHSNDVILEKEGITSSGLGLYICNKLAKDNNSNLIYTIEDNIIKFKLIIPKVN